MIKWCVMLWLVTAGGGISYSMIKERKQQLLELEQMETIICRLAYYMCRWQMTAGEAVDKVCEEQEGIWKQFLEEVCRGMKERSEDSLCTLWQEKTKLVLEKPMKADKTKGRKSRQDFALWYGLFVNTPMEPEELNRRLGMEAKKLAHMRGELSQKYKKEQRLIGSLGVFGGAFLCLILW